MPPRLGSARRFTPEALLGLLIALLALPAVSLAFRWWFGIYDTTTVIARELLFFALAGVLLLLMRSEGWSVRAIGFGTASAGRSALRALVVTNICFGAVFVGMLVNQTLGLRFGSSGGQAELPVWATLLVVLRSALVEELFYRGYAIGRLQKLTGSQWLAALIPLAAFALAHYRQGAGGVLVTFLLGGVLTLAYLRHRDLVAVMLAHFTINFLMNVVLPALG